MTFVDEALVSVKADDGGRGCMAFLREKYRPHGEPSGDDVIFRTARAGLAARGDLAAEPTGARSS